MKKAIALITVMVTWLALTGCGTNSKPQIHPDSGTHDNDGGFTRRAEDMLPRMTPGTVTNLTLAASETVRLSMTVFPGTVYTLDLVSTNRVAAYVEDGSGSRIGKALSAYGFTFTAAANGKYRVTVVGGPDAGPCRLGVYTNCPPFYRVVTNIAERPAFMTNQWYGGTEFGYVHVPASRESNDPHSYRLPVLRLASGPNATNGPMIYLSGGPGSSALNQIFLFKSFTNICEIIIMNQRGTYLSQPDLMPYSTNETTTELQARLGGPDGIDFNTINTRENAADVHDILTVLGYDKFNIWGTSYGTMLAQEVLRQRPERIRSLVLDGVVTLDSPQWTTMGQSFYDALLMLIKDICQSDDANRLYPDFERELLGLADERYPDDYSDFFEAIFHQMNLSRWGRLEDVPGLVWRAARGETAALAGLAALNIPIINPPPDGPMSKNMYAIMLRHDMLPFESMTNAAALTNSIPFPLNIHGYAYSQCQFDNSADWAFIAPVDESFRTAVTNDVPVLVLNGRYDTQTSLVHARHVANNLPHIYYVELPYTGHVTLFGGNVPAQIGRDFLANPSVFPDTNGVTGMSLTFTPPWPTNAGLLAADGVPRTNNWEWNGLGAVGTWYRFAAATGEFYQVEIGSSNVAFDLSIVNTNAVVLARNNTSQTDWVCPLSGEYYLWLVGTTSSTFTVTLTGSTNTTPQGSYQEKGHLP